MNLNYTKNFLKHYQRRVAKNKKLANRFQEKLDLFLWDPQNPILRDHRLTGARKHLRAFSVTGDVRVLYYREGNEIYLVDIGTHSQVY